MEYENHRLVQLCDQATFSVSIGLKNYVYILFKLHIEYLGKAQV